MPPYSLPVPVTEVTCALLPGQPAQLHQYIIRDLEDSSESKEQMCLSPLLSLFLFPVKATLAAKIKNTPFPHQILYPVNQEI